MSLRDGGVRKSRADLHWRKDAGVFNDWHLAFDTDRALCGERFGRTFPIPFDIALSDTARTPTNVCSRCHAVALSLLGNPDAVLV